MPTVRGAISSGKRRDLVAAGVTAKRDKEKKRIDSIAAAYILEGYLAKNKTGDINMNMKEEREELDEENNIVKPEQIDDAKATFLAKDIAKKIESELEYPGQIKVNVIREFRSVEFAK